jgi:hypothetical protein
VIVALRFLSGGLCFILLSLECYSAVDLRFAIDLQEGEGKQARNDANEHPADEKRPNHGRQLVSVSGRESREGGGRRARTHVAPRPSAGIGNFTLDRRP